jgi:hypothetical protein
MSSLSLKRRRLGSLQPWRNRQHKAIAEAQKIVATWSARQAGGRLPLLITADELIE